MGLNATQLTINDNKDSLTQVSFNGKEKKKNSIIFLLFFPHFGQVKIGQGESNFTIDTLIDDYFARMVHFKHIILWFPIEINHQSLVQVFDHGLQNQSCSIVHS